MLFSTSCASIPSPAQLLVPRRSRCLFILLQTRHQLPKPLLARPPRTTSRPLPTQIHQFCNPLPARAASGGILSTGQELLGFFAGLGDRLVSFRVVAFVEVVDGGLRGFDRFGFL